LCRPLWSKGAAHSWCCVDGAGGGYVRCNEQSRLTDDSRYFRNHQSFRKRSRAFSLYRTSDSATDDSRREPNRCLFGLQSRWIVIWSFGSSGCWIALAILAANYGRLPDASVWLRSLRPRNDGLVCCALAGHRSRNEYDFESSKDRPA